jgi:hypothetical protein
MTLCRHLGQKGWPLVSPENAGTEQEGAEARNVEPRGWMDVSFAREKVGGNRSVFGDRLR